MSETPTIPAGVHKRPKGSVLYLEVPGHRYECRACVFFQTGNLCLIHSKADEIKPDASCGYFIEGRQNTFKGPPLGLVTKGESGYVEAVEGASCKRCEYFNPEGDCALVDKDSPGDTPGCICPDACCCLWEEK